MRRHNTQVIPVEPGDGRCRAFSLIELVVVIVITGLLATLALPRFADAQQRYRLRLAGQRLVADLQLAGARARQAGAQRTVTFDASRNRYELGGVTSLDRPGDAGSTYGVDLSAEPYAVRLQAVELDGGGNQLAFSGHGLPDRSGWLTLSSGGSTITVTIDAASGEVTLP
ncbi:MAG: GspH/FimT family pseudopilin [Planctomycetota bacterium]|jgi:prepilin-type N-terminal cleavage/methylation domain-containing protein